MLELMASFSDFQRRRRIFLICLSCWVLVFFHVGVNSQYSDKEPTFEIRSSGFINTMASFNCILNNSKQVSATFTLLKSQKVNDIAILFKFGSNLAEAINQNYQQRITYETGQIATNTYFYNFNITELKCSDEGEYKCAVKVGFVDTPATKTLLIKTKPLTPTLTAPLNYVVVGDVVTLRCSAIVGKPAQNLSLCVSSQGQSFNCSEVSEPKDLGNCSYSRTIVMNVTMTEDTNQATCHVVTENPDDFKVTRNWQVQYPVLDIKFVPDKAEMELNEGGNAILTCEARGNPSPSFRWEFQPKDGQPLRNISSSNLNKLNLKNVDLRQSGVYTCIAFNTIRNTTYNMTKAVTIIIVPTTPAPTTTPIATTTSKSGTNATTRTGPQTNEPNDGWKLIVGIIAAILFLIILIIILVFLYRRRSKPAEIEEPPEKPRNNHEVNMKETKPDLVYSTGIEKGKYPMYNTGFDHNGEDDLYYAELAFDDKPRSRKPIVPLYDNTSNLDPYTTVMPQV